MNSKRSGTSSESRANNPARNMFRVSKAKGGGAGGGAAPGELDVEAAKARLREMRQRCLDLQVGLMEAFGPDMVALFCELKDQVALEKKDRETELEAAAKAAPGGEGDYSDLDRELKRVMEEDAILSSQSFEDSFSGDSSDPSAAATWDLGGGANGGGSK